MRPQRCVHESSVATVHSERLQYVRQKHVTAFDWSERCSGFCRIHSASEITEHLTCLCWSIDSSHRLPPGRNVSLLCGDQTSAAPDGLSERRFAAIFAR